jgi:hypothetical protein
MIAVSERTTNRRMVFSIPQLGWRQTGRHLAKISGIPRAMPVWCAQRILAERDRWVLWTPVGFGGGIGAYFGLPSEPPLFTGMATVAVLSIVLWISRARTGVVLPWLVLIVLASGFTAAQIRTAMVPDHLLRHAVRAPIIGTVLSIEERPTRPRILLGDVSLEMPGTTRGISRVGSV